MSLLDHAIWWHVYPLGAVGAPGHQASPGESGDGSGAGIGPSHRLPRLVDWLDYAVELGCSGLLLGPIFASTTHGYDTVDHFRIDPRLGDDDDFDVLVAQARRRGLSIVLDGVFNHVGVQHPLVAQTLEGGSRAVRVRHDGGQVRPEPWEGHGDLALLDHDDPAVADLVVEIMLHWLRRGIAGWRLDVAYAVPPSFWREVTGRVRREFPDAFFLGEVVHGDYAEIAAAGGLDSVTQYELWKAMWSSLADRNLWELAWALKRHDAFSAKLVTQTFVGNHDVTRIASRVGDTGAALAAAMLFTLPGMPSIYYGDEHGFRGEKGTSWGADDALRPALPARPGELAPTGWPLYRLHQDLIGLRRRNPWLTRGSVRVLDNDCTWIRYEVRGEGHALEVRIDLDGRPQLRVCRDGAEIFTWSS